MTDLTIHRTATGYALTLGGDRGARLRALTGSDTAPMPFTRQADPAEVLRSVQASNPGKSVRFA